LRIKQLLIQVNRESIATQPAQLKYSCMKDYIEDLYL